MSNPQNSRRRSRPTTQPNTTAGPAPRALPPGLDPDPVRDTRRVEAEVAVEDGGEDQDGVLVRLTTDRGEADILVPPIRRWRSSARAAAFTRGDYFTWAVITLTRADAIMWATLDPTGEDWDAFLLQVMEANGQDLGESGASRRSSPRTRGR